MKEIVCVLVVALLPFLLWVLYLRDALNIAPGSLASCAVAALIGFVSVPIGFAIADRSRP